MTAINDVTDFAINDGIAIVTLNAPPVNALTPAVMEGMWDAITQALDDDAVKAILLICAGRTFIAGADLKSLGKVEPKVDYFELQDKIESAGKPTIAAIHGTALGGGLETALTFHYRIAAPGTRMGLPEVSLGLLPGGGGTQRLPRIVGAEAALDLMLSGRQTEAREALAIGLIDRIATEGQLLGDALAYARELVSAGVKPKRVRDLDGKTSTDRNDPELFDRVRVAHAKQFKGLDAPAAILRCVQAAVQQDFEEGLQVERAEFQKLLHGPQSAALRHIFMAERAAQKIPGLPKDITSLTVDKVGIIGAGLMGSGIAMAFLNAGYAVTIIDTTQTALDRGVHTIRSTITSKAERGRISQEAAQAQLEALTPTLELAAVADADLVIEAVFENMAVKKELMARLGCIARPDAILATNTSFLNVDEIAAAASHPERVLGMHFFSPAHVMRLLEVVRGAQTSTVVLATAMQIARKLGKAAAVSGVCPGFIGNRMGAIRQKQADQMVLEGVLPWVIDRVVTDFGFPMGPFAMLDLAGLDLEWEGSAAPVTAALVAAGRKGQKTGTGYYDYDTDRQASPAPATLDIIARIAPAAPGSAKLSDQDILDRLLLPMINEGAKILEEGIAYRGSDIDLVWVTGYGWPPQTGGPMFHGDFLGLDQVAEGLSRLPGVTLSPLLKRLAGEKGSLAAYGQ